MNSLELFNWALTNFNISRSDGEIRSIAVLSEDSREVSIFIELVTDISGIEAQINSEINIKKYCDKFYILTWRKSI